MKKRSFFALPKVKDHHTRNSVFLYVLLVILILLFTLVTVILKVTRDDLRTQTKLFQMSSGQTLERMIREASDNLYQPALIEPKERKQYIYELGVRFPITGVENRVIAGVGSSSGNGPEYASVTSPGLQATARSILSLPADGNVEGLIKTVPMFQKCSRPFLIQYSAAPLEFADEFMMAGAKPLANGKTLYIFKSTACHSRYHDGDKYTQAELDRLQAQLLQAESY